MMLDSSLHLSQATENNCFPQGNPPIGASHAPASTTGDMPQTEAAPWCYLYTHHMKAPFVEQTIKADGQFDCFVHRSYYYSYAKGNHGVKRRERPTVGGLVFLHGHPDAVRPYLTRRLPAVHLAHDCTTHAAAVIADRQMQQFIHAAALTPEGVTFLDAPFQQYIANHTLIRITTGPLAGLEGYIIRIRRDRKLIMNLGGLAVAVSGVYGEGVEEVKPCQN